MTIELDASNMGWGARQGKQQIGEMVQRGSLTPYKINYLELLAAFLALQCFAKHSHGVTIQMKLDNVTEVTYINKLGGMHSLPLCQLSLTI